MTYILMMVAFSFFFSFPVVAGSPSSDDSQKMGLFSNFSVNGETGDCGGYELWLLKKKKSLYGFLSVHEGNCTSEKKRIKDVKYDPKTGEISFKVTHYSDDFSFLFKGNLNNDRVTGTFYSVSKADNQKAFTDMVVLSKVPELKHK